jgi:hypothetical protein
MTLAKIQSGVYIYMARKARRNEPFIREGCPASSPINDKDIERYESDDTFEALHAFEKARQAKLAGDIGAMEKVLKEREEKADERAYYESANDPGFSYGSFELLFKMHRRMRMLHPLSAEQTSQTRKCLDLLGASLETAIGSLFHDVAGKNNIRGNQISSVRYLYDEE